MSNIDVDDDLQALPVVMRLRVWVDPIYLPALLLGFAAQLLGLVLRLPELVVVGLVLGALADLATADERSEVRGRLRRFGLGLLYRVVFRALPLVAVMGLVGAPLWALVTYLAGVLLVGVATRSIAWILGKVVTDAPAVAERNLDDGMGFADLLSRLRARRLQLVGWSAAVEVPLAIGVWAAAEGHGPAGPAGLVTAGVLLAAGIITLLATTSTSLWWGRRALRSGLLDRAREATEQAIADTGAQVVLYFSGDADASYQINQWLPTLNRLERPVLVVLRERSHLDEMVETHHPIVFCRRHRDVEVALACDPRVVLYVATAGRNVHFLRYGRPRHVFLNHGDSDKVSSANPVVKVYDRLFVAGEVAIERYRAAGIDLPDDRFALVGRPQLDRLWDRGRRVDDGPPTLLYAPTWEGFYDAADYSSLAVSGEQLIRRVLEQHPGVRVVFKPHPASGTVQASARRARERVTALVREAGEPHLVAEDHPELDLFDWFDRADVLVSDVSAVVTDFLATDKPYLITNPRGLERERFMEMFPSHCAAYLLEADLADLDDHLAAAFGDDPLAVDRATMKRRVLGDHPEGAFAAFTAALDEEIVRAERDAEHVVNTFAYDT
ncbi:MAG: CDP-glycerol glycerophosphotransferase family protein [Nitriliruptoraceae bacterium]